MIFTDLERDYLASQPLGRLKTVSEMGAPQNNPVGFAFNEATGTIDIGGLAVGRTRKFANVAATGVAALVVDDLVSRDPWAVQGIETRGRAEAITVVDRLSSYAGGEIIRLHPSRVISWGLDPDHPGMNGRSIPASGNRTDPQRGRSHSSFRLRTKVYLRPICWLKGGNCSKLWRFPIN